MLIFLFIVLIISTILVIGHWLVYAGFVYLLPIKNNNLVLLARSLVVILPSFVVVTTWLARKFPGTFSFSLNYITYLWLALLNYLFISALLIWIFYLFAKKWRERINFRRIWITLVTLSLLVFIYGLINAQMIRVAEYEINLNGNVPAWGGRKLVWMSDVHLGPINKQQFLSDIVDKINSQSPAMVVIGGDLFDGRQDALLELAAPLKNINALWGTYFITGNHEEFTNHNEFTNAIIKLGVKPLANDTINIAGLNFVGVGYNIGSSYDRLGTVLLNSNIDRDENYILLSHYPGHLKVAERSGIDLQISGHSHRGQFWPYNHLTSLIFGGYDYGLNKFREMSVITSSGVGTWGPPIRVFSNPEIVIVNFK